MQVLKRRSEDRGLATPAPWLLAKHTFSFAEYHDPQWTRFSKLRVLNHDIIKGGGGFPMHPHNDMEIMTYIIRGAIKHSDSMGHQATITAGEVQLMGAGTGVTHSEFNASKTEDLELLQIWFFPDKLNLVPFYAEKKISDIVAQAGIKHIVSSATGMGAMHWRQDADVFEYDLSGAQKAKVDLLKSGRNVWVHNITGKLSIVATDLEQGDSLGIKDAPNELNIEVGHSGAKGLIFSLP
jgi:redox-sensitive bicupin YhaK (pirin superfamily)